MRARLRIALFQRLLVLHVQPLHSFDIPAGRRRRRHIDRCKGWPLSRHHRFDYFQQLREGFEKVRPSRQ